MKTPNADKYLEKTVLLDYDRFPLQNLVERKGWKSLQSPSDRIGAVHQFVRDYIRYGFASDFQIPASEILRNGIGSSLDKTILMMALLRSVGIPCRMVASIADKVIHRGILGWFPFRLCPADLYHASVEVLFNRKWIELEGYIVDKDYISRLQQRFPDYSGSFYGHGIATLNFRNPTTNWEENRTTIQDKAVIGELGRFDDPDSFFLAYPEAQRRARWFLYRKILRPRLNEGIRRMRGESTRPGQDEQVPS